MSKFSLNTLGKLLADKSGLSQVEAELFIRKMFDVCNQGLDADKQVKIKWLGTFKVQATKDRESINVNTGERFTIEGRDKLTFTPDNILKEIVNKPFAQFETVVVNDGVDFDEIDEKFGEEQTEDAPEQVIDFLDEEKTATPNPEVVVIESEKEKEDEQAKQIAIEQAKLERLKQAQLEQERIQKEKQEQERLEQERLEQEKLELAQQQQALKAVVEPAVPASDESEGGGRRRRIFQFSSYCYSSLSGRCSLSHRSSFDWRNGMVCLQLWSDDCPARSSSHAAKPVSSGSSQESPSQTSCRPTLSGTETPPESDGRQHPYG